MVVAWGGEYRLKQIVDPPLILVWSHLSLSPSSSKEPWPKLHWVVFSMFSLPPLPTVVATTLSIFSDLHWTHDLKLSPLSPFLRFKPNPYPWWNFCFVICGLSLWSLLCCVVFVVICGHLICTSFNFKILICNCLEFQL